MRKKLVYYKCKPPFSLSLSLSLFNSKSPTNVDWFILDTDSGDAPRIHRAVDYWAHHIVEQANNMIPSRSSSIGANVSYYIHVHCM